MTDKHSNKINRTGHPFVPSRDVAEEINPTPISNMANNKRGFFPIFGVISAKDVIILALLGGGYGVADFHLDWLPMLQPEKLAIESIEKGKVLDMADEDIKKDAAEADVIELKPSLVEEKVRTVKLSNGEVLKIKGKISCGELKVMGATESDGIQLMKAGLLPKNATSGCSSVLPAESE